MAPTLSRLFLLICLLSIPAYASYSLKTDSIEQVARREALKKVLKDYPFLVSRDVSIVITNASQLATIPPEVKSFDLSFDDISTLLGKTVISIPLYNQKGRFVQNISVGFDVGASSEVVRLSRPVRAGEVLTENALLIERRDIYGLPTHWIKRASEAVGKEAIYALPDGVILNDRQIRSVPVVRRGNRITLLFRKDNLEVKISGEALEDGGKGDTIKVRTLLERRKSLEGTVLDAEKVRISLAP